MKKGKKGFTILEIIICIGILVAIAGIFSINFIKNLNSNREKEYRETIKKIESATDAYVTMHKESQTDDYEDIKLVIANDDTFTYITLDELKNDGLINDQNLINPITGKELHGLVKFSKDKEIYDYKYIDAPEDYITVIYDRNGANSISRTARAFHCPNRDISTCVKEELTPSIVRNGGRVFGWSTDRDATYSTYKANTLLKNLLNDKSYEIIDDKIKIYAITSEEISIYFEDYEKTTSVPEKKSCTVYNTTPSCKITLPNYRVDSFHNNLGWNTNISATGYNYKVDTELQVSKNMTLYTEKEVKPFDLKVNRLKRTSGKTVIPSNVNIIFILDTSGSMSSGRLEGLKKVTTGLVDNMNFANSTVSLVTFDTGSDTILEYETDRLRVKSEISRLYASGGTNFKAAIQNANVLLNAVPNEKSNFVILVSDGYPTVEISATGKEMLELKNKATIYTMGIGSAHDASYLRALASKPETYYSYDEYTDDRELSKFYAIFQDIVEKITILEGDGEENAITERVTDGKLSLGTLVLSEKYPLNIYLGNTLLNAYIDVNEYLYRSKERYYFDVYEYAKNNRYVGLQNMASLRIKFFYTEDERK